MSPYSDIQRGFTGESNTLPLTSLQTIATQRVRWFARLAKSHRLARAGNDDGANYQQCHTASGASRAR